MITNDVRCTIICSDSDQLPPILGIEKLHVAGLVRDEVVDVPHFEGTVILLRVIDTDGLDSIGRKCILVMS